MALDGRTFILGKGETLDVTFSVKDGSAYLDLDLYDVTLTAMLDGSAVTFGTATVVSGTPDKVRLLLTAAQSAALAEGFYTGKVVLALKASPYTTVEALLFTATLYAESMVSRIPMNEASIYDILKLSKESVDAVQLRRCMKMAENRVLQWVPEQVRVWTETNGWPDRVVSEAENVAALLLRRELYDNDQTCRDDLREAQAVISSITLDTNFDGTRDTGNSCEVKIVRAGRSTSKIIYDQGRLRATNAFPLYSASGYR